MQPIEVIRVVNDPIKYAKTEKQKELVKQYREAKGMTVVIRYPLKGGLRQ